MSLDNVRIVLVRPQGSANVGSAARAMKNMGLSDLVLVQPELTDRFWSEAMAAQAQDVLDRHRTSPSLAEATADCGLVLGASAERLHFRHATRTPRHAAQAIVAAAATNRVAVVFGPEDHGLSNQDLKHCQQLVTIPSHPDYPSLNLAQAVMVCCYEIFLATQADSPAPPELAPAAATTRMFDHLQRALLKIGFLKEQNPEHLMYSIRRMLGRAEMDARDVHIWMGIARQIEWLAARIPPPPNS